jgi:hypothetical protein
MPALHNQRHEAFARGIAEGKSLAAAFVAAGYRPHPANPTRLRGRREIDERIGEIRATQQLVQERALERAIDEASITCAEVLRMLIETYNFAREKGQIGAAVRAAELLGKSLGMFVERREVTVEQRIAMMTDEQRLEEAGRLADRIRRRLDENRHLIDVTPERNE